MTYTYRPKGVCSQRMTIELEDGVQVQVAVRVGIGFYPHDGEDVDTLLRRAQSTLQA